MRALVLLLVLAVAALAAPAAMAEHCFKCEFIDRPTCWPTPVGGRPTCDDSRGYCFFVGDVCGNIHGLTEEPLAAEFVVASVERLDEPQPAPEQPRVASLASPAPTR